MNEIDYKSIIPYKVKDIIAFIMVHNNMAFREAIDYLYNSQLYQYLSREETKIWH